MPLFECVPTPPTLSCVCHTGCPSLVCATLTVYLMCTHSLAPRPMDQDVKGQHGSQEGQQEQLRQQQRQQADERFKATLEKTIQACKEVQASRTWPAAGAARRRSELLCSPPNSHTVPHPV